MCKLTFLSRIYLNTKGQAEYLDLSQVFSSIKTGQVYSRHGFCDLAAATGKIRTCITHKELQKMKLSMLPAINFNGTFEDGNMTNHGIIQYSSFVALDYDHFRDEALLQQTLRRLQITPCVAFVYRTPSGHGLKAVIMHNNTDIQQHDDLYNQLLKKFYVEGVTLDSTCRNLQRFHYLCYDPNAWINYNVTPFHYVPSVQQPIMQIPVQLKKTEGIDTTISDMSILNILKYRCKKYYPQYLIEGYRHEGIYWFGLRCGEAGIDYQIGLKYVENLYNGDDITYTYGSAMLTAELTQHFKRGYDNKTYDQQVRTNYKNHKTS